MLSTYLRYSIGRDTQDAATQLNSIITDAANITLKKYSRKVNGQNTKGIKKKHNKNKNKWFDVDLKALRNRVNCIPCFPKIQLLEEDTINFKGFILKLKKKKKKREAVQKSTVRAN